MNNKLLKPLLIASIALYAAACGGGDDPQVECTLNDECVGDRVCTNGVCVDPAGSDPDMMTVDPQDMGSTPEDMNPDSPDTGTPQPDAQPDLTVEDSGPSAGCTFDDDCGPTQVCDTVTSTCEETCIDDLDCSVGEECVPAPGGAGNVCRPEQPGCTENADCTEQPDGVCFNGECDYPVQMDGLVWVMILDESSGDAACDQTDPGSDIMGARLLDSGGQLLGWADAGSFSQGDSGTRMNRYDTTVRLDGTSNGLDGESCPEAGSRLSMLMPPPLSLGCGGWVLLRFVDAMGQPIEITDDSRIEVLEYGSTCGGSSDDSYTVYLCTDTLGAQGGSDSSCTYGVGGAQEGFASISVML